MNKLAHDLRGRRARVRGMGGPEAIAWRHADGKLTVREPVDLLFDAESFQGAARRVDLEEIRRDAV